MSYSRATDPFPLESPEQNKLHEFYARLARGELVTTRCARCSRLAWPPRAFCPDCVTDEFTWAELPREGRVHGYSVQSTGVPSGFPSPRVFAVAAIGDLRIFAPIAGPGAETVRVGAAVRVVPVRVADDVHGKPRHVVGFTLADGPGEIRAGEA